MRKRTVRRNLGFEWPDLQIPKWKTQGLCHRARLSPEQAIKFFFPPENSNQVEITKKICDRCPVKQTCLEAGMEGNEYGIWGGTTREERMRLKRNIKRRVVHDIQKEPAPQIAADNDEARDRLVHGAW